MKKLIIYFLIICANFAKASEQDASESKTSEIDPIAIILDGYELEEPEDNLNTPEKQGTAQQAYLSDSDSDSDSEKIGKTTRLPLL